MDAPNTIVCSGPTISAYEIKTILPEACVHHPIRCGDLVKLIRLAPKRIIIIDGYYEGSAAVWHKEILLALSLGIEVIGCASMGALRAAELDQFGMIGMGTVYEWYRDGVIDGDDEVAVLHHSGQADFLAQNEALVNIRASLSIAKAEKLINDEQVQRVIYHGKNIFYPFRQYEKIFKNAEAYPGEFSTLFDWLKARAINQKYQDALTCLDWAKNHAAQMPIINFKLEETIYLQRLILQMNADCFSEAYHWLPKAELEVRSFNQQKNIEIIQKIILYINICATYAEVDDIFLLQDWLMQQKQTYSLSLPITNHYQALFSALWEDQLHPIELFIDVFLVLNKVLEKAHIHCQPSELVRYRQWLLKEMRLDRPELLDQWLVNKSFNKNQWLQFISQLARFRFAYGYFLGQFIALDMKVSVKNWLFEYQSYINK